jgi:hypothetical protein
VIRTVACALALVASCGPAEPAADAPPLYEQRVALLMLADSADLAGLRAQHGADDFATIADDMMWYRAEAIAWLEEHDIPTVDVAGRPSLRFRVRGTPREFDFADETLLDLVVLYDTDRAPLALPTVEVALEGATYFGLGAGDSL